MKSINRLMDALDELKQNKNYEKIKIELTTEELNVLVNRIYEYTIKLASENAVELTDDELRSSDNTILNLQNYLKVKSSSGAVHLCLDFLTILEGETDIVGTVDGGIFDKAVTAVDAELFQRVLQLLECLEEGFVFSSL